MSSVMKLTRASKRELKLDRLCADIRNSDLLMAVYRENRKRMIRLDAGADWSDNAANLRRPYNGISIYKQVMLRALINQTPQCMLTAQDQKYRPLVRTAQNWANRQFKKIDLGTHLTRFITSALFGPISIMKVGVVTPTDAERVGFGLFAGEVFAENISFDDWIYDMQARVPEECGYMGHRTEVGVDVANRRFKLTGDNKLEPDGSDRSFNHAGDERAFIIGRGWDGTGHSDWRDRCDLWEFYLPTYRAVVTMRARSGGLPTGEDDLLEAREYVGPYCGPYTILSLIDVPDQLPGKGPIADQIPFDLATNQIFRKLIRQAERFKQLDIYNAPAADDAAKINKADDGEMVAVARMSEIKPWMSTPPNAQLFALALQFKQIHSQICGNIEVIGGLARQAGTASQENLINQNASATVASLQSRVLAATSKIMNDMLWHWWHDNSGVMTDTYSLDADPENQTPRAYGPQHRKNLNWEEIDCKVDPYSLVADTPGGRVQALQQAIQTAVPLTPIMQANGQSLDTAYYYKKLAEYMNNPDIAQLVRVSEPTPPESPDEGPGKSPVTERTYTRKSESEATQDGQDSDMIQQMMGSGATGAGDFGGSE